MQWRKIRRARVKSYKTLSTAQALLSPPDVQQFSELFIYLLGEPMNVISSGRALRDVLPSADVTRYDI